MSLAIERLLDDQGDHALALAGELPDPSSMAAAEYLRRHLDPELAALASAQVALRRRARVKFGSAADDLFFTVDGLEQASRPQIARWRAGRFVAAGITRVIDLGCGIGTDALAFAQAGLRVSAVEIDETTAAIARANLADRGEVICGDATVLGPELVAGAEETTALFLDPARRSARGRSWRVQDLSPGWDFVCQMLEADLPTCVKLGPGIPRELIPTGVEACWVTHQAQTLETGLWTTPDACRGLGRAVVVFDDAPPAEVVVESDRPVLPVRAPGRYLIEPVGSLIRARGLAELGDDLWLLDAQAAYLGADHPVSTPFATCFEILEVLDYRVASLRAWVKAHGIGIVEIKRRAVKVDPAQLRRQLKPSGPNSATLIIARTPAGTRVLVARRVTGRDPR